MMLRVKAWLSLHTVEEQHKLKSRVPLLVYDLQSQSHSNPCRLSVTEFSVISPEQ